MKTMIFILSFLIISNLYSQPTQQWLKRISSTGNHNESGYDIVSDGSGSVYIAGTYYNSGNISNSFYVAKLSGTTGAVTWQNLNNGTANATCVARKIMIDGAGNIYAAGIVQNTTQDIFIAKYTPSGNTIWTRTYNYSSTSDDDVNSICLDAANSIYIAGYKNVSDDKSYLTIKYDSAGTVKWAQTHNPTSELDQANGIAIGDSGYVYVTGVASNTMTTIKYSSAGLFKWQKVYGDGTVDQGRAITTDASGNIYVTGYDSDNPPKGILTIKYNSQGIQQWLKSYQNIIIGSADYGTEIKNDGSSIYVTGNSGDNVAHTHIVLIKYDLQGNQLWVNRYTSPSNDNDVVNKMAVDVSGNIYLTGYSTGIGTSRDIVLIKYNPAGVQQWAQIYNGPDNLSDESVSMAIESNGNVYMNGYSNSNTLGKDMFIIKYSQVTGIDPVNNQISSEYKLSQNYPNPFNPSTNIEFNIPKRGNVKLVVYDELGKVVSELVNETLNKGAYNINFDASGFSSGIYFYMMKTDGFTNVKKMIILK